MIPKDKAEELVNKFYWRKTNHNVSVIDSKQCALIAVDEILAVAYWNNVKEFWLQVKQEIENL